MDKTRDVPEDVRALLGLDIPLTDADRRLIADFAAPVSYTVTYRPTKASPEISVPVVGRTADEAWHAFTAWREENGITDYHSAAVTAPATP